MRVMMLGWEYPPHIAGGLGVACEGLSRALAERGHVLHFVVPSLFGGESAPHMRLIDASSAGIERVRVPTWLLPYGDAPGASPAETGGSVGRAGRSHHYGADLFAEVDRYAQRVAALGQTTPFDVIHAHDWMTIPAGLELRRRTGRPLILHVHSLEFDRAGEHGHPGVIEVERRGYTQADGIVAVSDYTKRLICRRHGIAPERVFVAHNGIGEGKAGAPRGVSALGGRPVVLFLGRLTFQKGADYFLRAAARVREISPEVMFVVAGSGDMLSRAVELVHELNLEDRVLFTGFLRGADVERAYASATLYVMPSVSEPFGLTALEAIRSGVPCILSRQSGVCEVVRNALRVDFWDTERLADLIINTVQSADLREQLVELSVTELAQLRWEDAARQIESVYDIVRSN